MSTLSRRAGQMESVAMASSQEWATTMRRRGSLEIGRLMNSEYDFPLYTDDRRTTYAIAATPRSGSSFLCLKLWETGLLGAPWEYFHLQFSWPLVRRLAPTSPEEYYNGVCQRRTSPNGVFGFKIFPKALAAIETELPGLFAKLPTDK